MTKTLEERADEILQDRPDKLHHYSRFIRRLRGKASDASFSRNLSSELHDADILCDITESMAQLISDQQARIRELEAQTQWKTIESAPKGIPVIVDGGLAIQKTGGEWFSGMEEPLYQRRLTWSPTRWMPLPVPPNPSNSIPLMPTQEEIEAVAKVRGK